MTDVVSPTDTSEPLRRRVLAVVLVISGAVVFLAERDLKSRSAAEIRGPKWLWRLGSTNAVVAFAYMRWGRR